MKYISLIALVVFLSLASACGSDQPITKTTPVVASSGSATNQETVPDVVEVPLDIANLKPEVDVAKLVDWSACRDAEMESYERKRDREIRAYEQRQDEDLKLYREFEKFRLAEADKLKTADLSAYYSWLEFKEKGEYEALKRLRLTSTAYAQYEDSCKSHSYKLERDHRQAKHRAVSDAIEKVYKEEGRIIAEAKKRLLRQK